MKRVGLLVIAMLFLCGTVYAERTIWYVHPDSALNTIQAGLDSCADNDIVLVGPGTYYENIIWPARSGLHLISELGREVTIIDGGNTAAVITMIDVTGSLLDTMVIRGFTIRNGNTSGSGGGIYGWFYGAKSVKILDNAFSYNSAGEDGGAVLLFWVQAWIGHNIFTNNTASICGGAIFMLESGAQIYDNSITYNTATMDGGGIRIDGFWVSILDNTIHHNTAGQDGGGICIRGLWAMDSIARNTITENTAQYGGGCAVDAGYVYGNTISYNNASIDGGGLLITPPFWVAGTTYVRKNVVTHNSAANHGNGICAGVYDSTAYAILDSNDICNNGSGLHNCNVEITFNAENNWWGDATGPYHPDSNPGGLGDTVSDYVDFTPWLTNPVSVEEQPNVKAVDKHEYLGATIIRGPLQLPKDKRCKVFDIIGRAVEPDKIQPGIYFIEVDGVVTQKVVKVR
jgi:hypothetical protein